MQEPEACELQPSSHAQLQRKLDKLQEAATAPLLERGFAAEQVRAERYLNLRFQGTDVALMVTADDIGAYHAEFLNMYQVEFGFVLQNRAIVVDDCRYGPRRRWHRQVSTALPTRPRIAL